jgi:predicted DCC family thiol-disulfide oxidoreductase YuxK
MGALPVFLYDGHCGFCRIWLEYLQAIADGKVEWIASQEAGGRFPQVTPEQLRNASAYIDTKGNVSLRAAAIFSVLALAPGRGWFLWLYKHVAPFRWISDWSYAFIAKHRSFAYTMTRLTFGRTIRPLDYHLIETVFLRLLGLIFLFAFWSLLQQIVGLAGAHGLIPTAQILNSMQTDLGSRAYLLVPTIFWFKATDSFLSGACAAGMLASLFLMFSSRFALVWQRLSVLACFVLYLSVISIGQPFTIFQWDALLLEAAFLSLFAGTPPLVWAFRLLTFRLMFESGCVKLLSGDPTWRNLHALRFHFMTQPLPNPIAWYVHQVPAWMLDSLTFLTLVTELGCPWLLFMPRRLRQLGAAALIALQIIILLTGNYAFFNWITIALCLWAFDDRSFQWFRRILKAPLTAPSAWFRNFATAILAALMILGSVQVLALFHRSVSAPFSPVMNLLGPFQIVNSYGLFAIMTTARPEIIFEGSNDGATWKEYSFPYKPGEVRRALPIVAPFQPRLDWQLWFAALDANYQEDRWTVTLAARLLEGEPTVIGLLDKPPFAAPPKYIRAQLYDYWFTSPAERKRTGAIWNRRYERGYLPAISLDMLQRR